MKNKKISILILIVLILSTLQATPVFALKRAVFPDSKSVQPLPKDVYPNISGNVNSTVNGTPTETPANNTSPAEEKVQKTQEENSNNSPSYVLWSIIIFLLIVIMFVFYFKSRKSN